MNTTWTIQSHSVLTLDYRAMNVYWTDSCVHSHVVSLCLHSQSPDTTGLASHTAYMERTSTHNLTRTQIWCVLECDAVYSCRDQQDFEGTCPSIIRIVCYTEGGGSRFLQNFGTCYQTTFQGTQICC